MVSDKAEELDLRFREEEQGCTRREFILRSVNTAARNFVYYDRKEDEDLSADDIHNAIDEGEITWEEIGEQFKQDLINDCFKPQISIGQNKVNSLK